MKKTGKKRVFEIILQITAVVLFVALIVLTFAMIYAFGKSSLASDNVPFDLDMLTSSKRTELSAIDGYLTPEFVGLTLDDEKYGISTSENIVSELYGLISPTLSELISKENFRRVGKNAWAEYTSGDKFVYVRYHSELSDNIIGLFADALSYEKNITYTKDRNHVLSYVYELLIMSSENGSMTRVATRSLDGTVSVYEGRADFDYNKIVEVAELYKSSLSRFVFSGEYYSSLLDTEPVFLDSVSTREITLSSNTGFFVFQNDSYRESVMRLFSVNPDKLLSEHEDSSGSITYTDIHGLLYIRMRGFEYVATSDGGVDIGEYVGYTSKNGIEEYIRATVEIISELRSINKYFVGYDAEPRLFSVEAADGRVRITFEYAVDNVRITGDDSAFVCEFEDGKLKYANLYAISARTLISKANSYSETWFFKSLEEGIVPRNVCLCYQSDYRSNSVAAKWAAFIPIEE